MRKAVWSSEDWCRGFIAAFALKLGDFKTYEELRDDYLMKAGQMPEDKEPESAA